MTFHLRDAVKSLRRDPVSSLTAVLTLALTIGATTAVFSVVDGVLLKPLAYPDSQRLVVIEEIVPELVHLYPVLPANARHFAVWRSRATSFDSLAAFQTLPLTLIGAGEPAQLDVVTRPCSGCTHHVASRPLSSTSASPASSSVTICAQPARINAWSRTFDVFPQVTQMT
jgi:hypothetical protein